MIDSKELFAEAEPFECKQIAMATILLGLALFVSSKGCSLWHSSWANKKAKMLDGMLVEKV